MLLEDTTVFSKQEPLFESFSCFKSSQSDGGVSLSHILQSIKVGKYLEQYKVYRQTPDNQKGAYKMSFLPCFRVGGLGDPKTKLAPTLSYYNDSIAFKLTGIRGKPLESLTDDELTYGLIHTLNKDEFVLLVRTDMTDPGDQLQRDQYVGELVHFLRERHGLFPEGIELLKPTLFCWPAERQHYMNPAARQWGAPGSIVASNTLPASESPSDPLTLKDKMDLALIQEVEKEMEQLLETSQPYTASLLPDQVSESEKQPSDPNDLLTRLLDKERRLKEDATKNVVFSPPLITHHGEGVIRRGTVNIIQGAYGSHKSRLAEVLASLMLTTSEVNEAKFLDFKRAVLERFCVCYIDTERNLTEELPFAIQGIKLRAGYQLDQTPEQFRFTSIKSEERANRFKAIETFIHHVRQQNDLHLFCLIDVVTDTIGDFNDPKESMKLFDFLGNLCDNYDTTFLLVIHQNPGTEKARGHTGTEAANKASTVLQISVEKDNNGNEIDLIKLRYLKLRHSKKPEPLYLQFCQESNGLRLADKDTLANLTNQQTGIAPIDKVVERLESLLSKGPIRKNELVTTLMNDFEASDRTIRNCLGDIAKKQFPMQDEEGCQVFLGSYSVGKNHYYQLQPLNLEE